MKRKQDLRSKTAIFIATDYESAQLCGFNHSQLHLFSPMMPGITNSMDMSLSKLQKIVKDKEAWRVAVHGVAKNQTRLSNWTITMKPGVSNYSRSLCRHCRIVSSKILVHRASWASSWNSQTPSGLVLVTSPFLHEIYLAIGWFLEVLSLGVTWAFSLLGGSLTSRPREACWAYEKYQKQETENPRIVQRCQKDPK